MQTICRVPGHSVDNISLYLFTDETPVHVCEDQTVVGDFDAPQFIILDCNSSNVYLYEGVEEPEDYCGWKYTYTPTTGWVLYEGWSAAQQTIEADAEA